jgi:hypothetical protein
MFHFDDCHDDAANDRLNVSSPPPFLQTRSQRLPAKTTSSKPTTSTKKLAKRGSMKTSKPLGKLIIGLPPHKADGKAGAKAKDFLRSTVAIGVKLAYTKLYSNIKNKSLRIERLIKCVNKVMLLALCKVPTVAGSERKPQELKEITLRRKFYLKDYKDVIPESYVGFSYEKLNGWDKVQMATYRRHVEATGLADLIYWLIKVVLDELKNPGTDKEVTVTEQKSSRATKKKASHATKKKAACATRKKATSATNKVMVAQASDATKKEVEGKVFSETWKRGLRIELVGVDALTQVVEAAIESALVKVDNAEDKTTMENDTAAMIAAFPSSIIGVDAPLDLNEDPDFFDQCAAVSKKNCLLLS